jgi:uronate dehydrogenase
MPIERVLITGAAGALGRVLRAHLRGRYPLLRLSDIAPMDPAGPGEEVVPADLADAPAIDRLLEGIQAVVHLGGHSVEGSWEQILRANVVGLVNLYEAARKAGTERVLFASSNHAVGFHRRWPRTDHTAAPKPDSRYGVSKAFGEILALYYANKHGIKGFCMRIGSARAEPVDERQLSTWQSYPDFCRLVDVGLTAWYRYEIVYGVSANTRSFWDNSNAERLGYRPEDDAEAWASKLEGVKSPHLVDELHVGGPFCSVDFTGRVEDIV